jgi:hypothetical protein
VEETKIALGGKSVFSPKNLEAEIQAIAKRITKVRELRTDRVQEIIKSGDPQIEILNTELKDLLKRIRLKNLDLKSLNRLTADGYAQSSIKFDDSEDNDDVDSNGDDA